jgi:hypothetical protein
MMSNFLNFGSAKGLDISHDFQRDIDRLYQKETYRSQVEAERANKAKYYASLEKEHNAVAPSMVKELENHYEMLNEKVANFHVNNPGWEQDVRKVKEYNNLVDGYLNNDYVRKDLQSQEQFELLKKARNTPGMLTEDEWMDEMEKYDSWMKNGGDGYIFSQPKRKTMPEILKQANDFLQPERIVTTDGREITDITSVNPDDLHMTAQTFYMEKDNKMAIDRAFDLLNENEKKIFNNNPVQYFEQLLLAGEPLEKIQKDYDALYLARLSASLKNKGQENPIPVRYYKTLVIDPLFKNGITPADPNNIVFTEFGGNGKYLAIGPQGRMMKGYNASGDVVDLNLNGQVFSISGGRIKNIGGVPYEEVTVGVMANPQQIAVDSEGNYITKEKTYTAEEIAGMSRRERKDLEDQIQEENAKSSNILLSDVLEDAGFINKKLTTLGLNVAQFSKEQLASDVMVGTILMPVNFSESNRIRFDQGYKTTTQISEDSQIYNQDIHIAEMIMQNNAPAVSSDINLNKKDDISLDAGKNVGNLSWNRSSNPMVWTSQDEDNYYKFDYTTGRHQILPKN